MSEPTQESLFGIPVVVDETVEPGVAEFRDNMGKTVGRIEGLVQSAVVDSDETVRLLASSPFRARYLAGLISTWRYGDRAPTRAERAAVDELAAEMNLRIEALP